MVETTIGTWLTVTPYYAFQYGPSYYILIVNCIFLLPASVSMFAAAKRANAEQQDLQGGMEQRYNDSDPLGVPNFKTDEQYVSQV